MSAASGALPQWSHLGLETIAVLGEGGMGVVYRVRDQRLQRDAALKLIKTGVGGAGPRALNRFRREVLVTAQLDHPGIPAVYDSGVDPQGQPYMLMRVVEGRPLSEIINEHHEGGGEMTRRGLVEVVLRVAEAVAYAHTQGIVHRDLKPANVMVGRFGEVLVMDWGLARELRTSEAEDAALRAQVATNPVEEAAQAGLTLQGAVVGTPGYMPPEQAGGGSVDARADVFALGALLCIALTGRPPVEGTTAINRLAATIGGKIATPRSLAPSVPRELDAIAASALAADREERTPHAQALIDDLRAYLAGEPVSTYRYSVGERLVRVLRRHAPLLAVGSLLVVSISGVWLVWSTSEAAKLEAEREAKETAKVATKVAAERARIQSALDLLARADRTAQRGGGEGQIKSLVEQALRGVRTPFTLNQAARVYQTAGMHDAAVALLEEVTERYPPAFPELFALHLLWRERHPEWPRSRSSAWGRLRALAERSEAENEFTRFLRAERHLEGGDVDGALRVYEELLAEAPRFTWALSQRAKIYLERGESRKALREAERAIASNSRFAPAILTRGAAHFELSNFAKALRDLSTAIQLQPTADAYVLRASVFIARNEGREVLHPSEQEALMADVRKAAALAPSAPKVLLIQGTAACQLQDYRAGIRFYDLAIKAGVGFLGYAQRGVALQRVGDSAGALRDFEQALKVAPAAGKPELRAMIAALKGRKR